jgi:hypothetical protein
MNLSRVGLQGRTGLYSRGRSSSMPMDSQAKCNMQGFVRFDPGSLPRHRMGNMQPRCYKA